MNMSNRVFYGFMTAGIAFLILGSGINLARILPLAGLFPIFAFAVLGFILWHRGWKKVEFRDDGTTTDDLDAELRAMLDTHDENR